MAPLNPLRALTEFVDFNYPIQTILAGHVYQMGDVPRWYVPTYMAIKLTLWLLFGAGLATCFRRRCRNAPAGTQQTKQRAGEKKPRWWRLPLSFR